MAVSWLLPWTGNFSVRTKKINSAVFYQIQSGGDKGKIAAHACHRNALQINTEFTLHRLPGSTCSLLNFLQSEFRFSRGDEFAEGPNREHRGFFTELQWLLSTQRINVVRRWNTRGNTLMISGVQKAVISGWYRYPAVGLFGQNMAVSAIFLKFFLPSDHCLLITG